MLTVNHKPSCDHYIIESLVSKPLTWTDFTHPSLSEQQDAVFIDNKSIRYSVNGISLVL